MIFQRAPAAAPGRTGTASPGDARCNQGKNCILREARRIDNAIKHFYDHLEDGPSG
jgi:hypothetical protein